MDKIITSAYLNENQLCIETLYGGSEVYNCGSTVLCCTDNLHRLKGKKLKKVGCLEFENSPLRNLVIEAEDFQIYVLYIGEGERYFFRPVHGYYRLNETRKYKYDKKNSRIVRDKGDFLKPFKPFNDFTNFGFIGLPSGEACYFYEDDYFCIISSRKYPYRFCMWSNTKHTKHIGLWERVLKYFKKVLKND